MMFVWMIINEWHCHIECGIVDNTVIVMNCDKIVGRDIIEMSVKTIVIKEEKYK